MRTVAGIEAIRERVNAVAGPLGHRVDAVVNDDRTSIHDQVEPAWAGMVDDLEVRLCGRVSRHSSSVFRRRSTIHESVRAAEEALRNPPD